jgi:hypothetical protein
MAHGIDATGQAAPSMSADKPPVLKAAELDADLHAVFRHYGRTNPVVSYEAEGYIVLRVQSRTRSRHVGHQPPGSVCHKNQCVARGDCLAY